MTYFPTSYGPSVPMTLAYPSDVSLHPWYRLARHDLARCKGLSPVFQKEVLGAYNRLAAQAGRSDLIKHSTDELFA